MFTTYKVTKTFKDKSKGAIIDPDGNRILIDANRNIIAIVEFPNDSDPTEVHTYYMNGNDLSDDIIAKQAFNIIASLNQQETNLQAITTDQVFQPKPIDPVITDLQKKQEAYTKAVRSSMAKYRNDPGELQALADLVAAEDAVVNNSADAVADLGK